MRSGAFFDDPLGFNAHALRGGATDMLARGHRAFQGQHLMDVGPDGGW
ncbi:hypothetical protein D558_0169 [Bordetella holmesii 44057]|nr:hypothetical protein D558_0169 [Bordetella holmesii 44057]